MQNKMGNFLTILSLTVLSFFWHYYLLGGVPPLMSREVLFGRIISATFSILVLPLVFILGLRLTQSRVAAFFSVFWLVFMPWHVEQSRLVSPVTAITFSTTLYIAVLLTVQRRLLRFLATVAYIYFIPITYPTLWIFTGPDYFIDIPGFLKNSFLIISSNFLFFENKAFGSGSLKVYGVMLWSTLPLFIFGLSRLMANARLTRIIRLWFLLPFFLAAMNPDYTGMEVFVSTPLFALILGFGTLTLIEEAKRLPSLKFLLLGTYAVLIAYSLMEFTHYYGVHYPVRIIKETQYASRHF